MGQEFRTAKLSSGGPGVSWGCCWDVGQDYNRVKAWLGLEAVSKSVPSRGWQAGAGCWQEAAVPCPVKPLHRAAWVSSTQLAGFPQSTLSNWTEQSGSVFYTLTLEVIHQHFWRILLVSHTNPDTFWVVTSEMHGYLEVRISGGHLEGWLPYSIVYFLRLKYHVTQKIT